MDVSIAEAKNRLPELIRAVENGEKVVITRHGKPVATPLPLFPSQIAKVYSLGPVHQDPSDLVLIAKRSLRMCR